MLVANDVSTDTRVRKMAHDLAAAGLDLTLLAISPTENRVVMRLGAAKVIRVPVDDLLSVRAGTGPHRMNRYELTRQIRAERKRFLNHQRDVGAEIGWLRREHARLIGRPSADPNGVEVKSARDQRIEHAIERTRGWPGRIPGAIVRRVLRPFLSFNRDSVRAKRMIRQEEVLRRKLAKAHQRYKDRQDRLRARLVDTRPRGSLPAEWRRLIPELHDYEAAFGPEIDALEPDLVHAQDLHLFGVGARAVARSLLAGRDTKLIYDSHEYIQGLGTYSPRVVAAWSGLEREYIGRADRVITVSPTIAEMLEHDYRLDRRPTVVMNIPVVTDDVKHSVREAAGVGSDVPLLIYSGGLDPTRGVHTLVKALGRLDGVHLALIARINHTYLRDLEEIARAGGYADRLHVIPFVEPQDVVSYLASATVGVHTIVAGPINHEVTLPNKVFEYMHARLPIVISSCRVMSEFVTDLEIGEVFVSEDVDSLAETISRVLENLEKYHAAYERQPEMLERYSWRTERRKLFTVYRELLGEDALPEDIDRSELAPLVDMKA